MDSAWKNAGRWYRPYLNLIYICLIKIIPSPKRELKSGSTFVLFSLNSEEGGGETTKIVRCAKLGSERCANYSADETDRQVEDIRPKSWGSHNSFSERGCPWLRRYKSSIEKCVLVFWQIFCKLRTREKIAKAVKFLGKAVIYSLTELINLRTF